MDSVDMQDPEAAPPSTFRKIRISLQQILTISIYGGLVSIQVGAGIDAIFDTGWMFSGAAALGLLLIVLPLYPHTSRVSLKCGLSLFGAFLGTVLAAAFLVDLEGQTIPFRSADGTPPFWTWQHWLLLHLPAAAAVLAQLWAMRYAVPRGRVQFSLRTLLALVLFLGLFGGRATLSILGYMKRESLKHIHNLAASGRFGQLRETVSWYPEAIRLQDEGGNTLLHALASASSVAPDFVTEILDAGAEINAANHDGDTPLHLACRHDRLTLVNLLLERDADINARNRAGRTPLMTALSWNIGASNRAAIAQRLLEAKTDVTLADNTGLTALHYAANAGFASLVQPLLDNGALLNATNEDGLTPLHLAVQWSSGSNTVDALIESGADVNAATKAGATPLHVAVWSQEPRHIETLLARRADVDAADNEDNTPLHTAAWHGQLECARILLTHGASPRLRNENGHTPLHLAAMHGPSELTALLEEQAHVTLTPHLLAALNRKAELAALAGKDKTALRQRDLAGLQPLHWAVLAGQRDTAVWLIGQDVNVNAQTNAGLSPLHMAAREGKSELVELLLAHGAQVNLRNAEWGTALHYAACAEPSRPIAESEEKARTSTVHLLLQANADPSLQDKQGLTPLHYAASRSVAGMDNLSALRALLQASADPNAADNAGNTPLHVLVTRDPASAGAVKLLLKYKADPARENAKGKTPVDCAEHNTNGVQDTLKEAVAAGGQ